MLKDNVYLIEKIGSFWYLFTNGTLVGKYCSESDAIERAEKSQHIFGGKIVIDTTTI